MKILNLIIKQQWFDEIIAGRKTEEYREIRPTTFKKYCRYLIDGKEYESVAEFDKLHPEIDNQDIEFDIAPIKYDAIRLYVGYNKDRDSALVEVTNAEVEYFVDENGDGIEYEYKGDVYLMCQMVYSLGKVLEKNIHPK